MKEQGQGQNDPASFLLVVHILCLELVRPEHLCLLIHYLSGEIFKVVKTYRDAWCPLLATCLLGYSPQDFPSDLPLTLIFQELCRYKGVEILEGHAMPDHVHICLSFPPKYSIAMTMGYIKGKSAIKIHRELLRGKRPFTGLHFWAPGYCVSTIGLNEAEIREYVKNQEKLEKEKMVN